MENEKKVSVKKKKKSEKFIKAGALMKLTKRMSLLQKLIVLILIIVVLPMTLIGILATDISAKALENQTEKSKAALAAQTSSMIDQEILRIEDTFLKITVSPTFSAVVKNLKPIVSMDSKEEAEWRLNRIGLIGDFDKEMHNSVASNKYIDSLTVAFATGDIVGSNINLTEGIDDIRDTLTYKSLLESKDLIWLTSDKIDISDNGETLLLGKRLKSNAYSDTEPVAVAMAEIKYGTFQKLLAGIKVGDRDMSYIILPNGTIISPLEYEKAQTMQDSAYVEEVTARANNLDADTFEISVDGENTIITYDRCDNTGIIYMLAIPEKEVLQGSRTIRDSILLIGIVFSTVAVFGGLLFAFGMTKALKSVVETMTIAAKGNLTVTVQTSRTDEIGKVADAFNTMVRSIREIITRSKNVSDTVNKTSMELTDISEQSSQAASEIADAINDVANGAGQQSEEADQSVRTFSGLANGINYVVDSTKVMEVEAANVKNYIIEGIQTANDLNAKAMEVNTITTEIVEQISSLCRSITGINKITDILKEISDQTKLLSLNATIESARSGEYGRGLTVVAEEIRKLADQSSVQTKQIEKLVYTIQSQADDSTSFVIKADAVIKEQVESVKDSTECFNKIDNATNELMLNISKIMEAIYKINGDKDSVINSINNMAAVSEMAAASAQEVSASTQVQLSSLEELNDMAIMLNGYSKNLDEALNGFEV